MENNELNINAKELTKAPFEVKDAYNKELKKILNIFDKYSKDINGSEKIKEEILIILLNSKDPILTWIQSNVLDDLNFPEYAIEFKLKAQELGYAIVDINEQQNIENYLADLELTNEKQEFMYNRRELTPWNIFDNVEKKEKEFNPYAVQNMLQHDMMMKFAYDHLKTGEFITDMKKLYDTYIKNNDDMLDTLKTYENYTKYIFENQNEKSTYASIFYDILSQYNLDISNENQLSTIINKLSSNLSENIEYNKNNFKLYTQDIKNAINAITDSLEIIDIIEKIRKCDVSIEDFKSPESDLSEKLDNEFAVPTIILNYISSIFRQTELEYLEFINNGEIATLLLMTSVAINLKNSKI